MKQPTNKLEKANFNKLQEQNWISKTMRVASKLDVPPEVVTSGAENENSIKFKMEKLAINLEKNTNKLKNAKI